MENDKHVESFLPDNRSLLHAKELNRTCEVLLKGTRNENAAEGDHGAMIREILKILIAGGMAGVFGAIFISAGGRIGIAVAVGLSIMILYTAIITPPHWDNFLLVITAWTGVWLMFRYVADKNHDD